MAWLVVGILITVIFIGLVSYYLINWVKLIFLFFKYNIITNLILVEKRRSTQAVLILIFYLVSAQLNYIIPLGIKKTYTWI